MANGERSHHYCQVHAFLADIFEYSITFLTARSHQSAWQVTKNEKKRTEFKFVEAISSKSTPKPTQ